MKDFSIQDQIDYLQSYAKLLQSQADMVEVQIKFLQAGEDNLSQMQKMFPLFNMMDWTNLQKK